MHFDEVEVQCPSCGETLSVPVDLSEGQVYEFLEDCAVCCRPIAIKIRFDAESGEAHAEVSPS